MSNPCYKCEDRNESCHAVCDRYIAWKSEQTSIREKALTEKIVDYGYDNYMRDRSIRAKKRVESKQRCKERRKRWD